MIVTNPIVFLLVFAFPTPETPRGMTPLDVMKLKEVTAATLSPDGKTVAYTMSQPPQPLFEGGNYNSYQVYIWDAERGHRPFITGSGGASNIRWTPDGKKLSFLAQREGDASSSVYVLPLAGGEARKVFSSQNYMYMFEWGPDENSLFFMAEDAPQSSGDFGGKGFNQEVFEEEALNSSVWAVDLSGAEGKERKLNFGGSAMDFSISPDGRYLAVASSPSSLWDVAVVGTRAAIYEAESGNKVMDVNNPGKLYMMRWSPDSSTLACIAAGDKHDPLDARLMVANLKQKKVQTHFHDQPGDVRYIAWQDAKTLWYLWDQGTTSTLKTFKLANTTSKTLFENGPGFTGLHVTPGGRAVLIGATPTHPREAFLWDQKQKKMTRLTHSNPWLSKIDLAPQQLVRYKARDGLDLEGLLILPNEKNTKKPYPLILNVHGGPEFHYRNAWLTSYSGLGQVAAARGFAVFYPNYRGSTGRGADFAKKGQGRPALEEFNDLLDAVNYLADDQKIIDKTRVGIIGESYGGYAAAWGATALSQHFAASVMAFGISDMVSYKGINEIVEENYLVHDRIWLWDNYQLFLEQSPIYHVKKHQTPLLILHGKKDVRVPHSQGLELYRHLKVLGQAPVRMVSYPDEGHGFSSISAQFDANLRALRWFETFLSTHPGKIPPKDVGYQEEIDASKP